MDIDAALMRAVKANDFNAVQRYFAQGANENYVDEKHLTPLMHAAAGGFYAVAVFLVKAGANFEKMTPKGEMAVTFARRNGHDAITRFLDEEYRKKHKNDKNDVSADMLLRMIETGTLEEVRDVATPESVNSTHPSDGSTPLHVAAKCGRSDIAQLLVETGARVDEVDPSGRTDLQFACEHGDSATVRYLVTSAAANVRVADKSGKTALHYACTQGGYSCVRILLTSGADSDVVDEDGLSPIDMAVSSGDLDIVRELNRQGASLNHVSKDGETILHRAIRSKKVELIEFLINQNVSVTVADKCGWTPLHLATRGGMVETCKLLLERGASVTQLTLFRQSDPSVLEPFSALDMAIQDDHTEIIALLRSYEATNVKVHYENGRTPLIVAAAKGNAIAIKQLLDAGADLNAQGNAGETALLMATIGGFAKAVLVLLEHGARTDIASHSGKTPLKVAKSAELRGLLQLYHNSQQYHDKCFALLNDADANPTVTELTELVPLITSVYDLRLLLTLVL